MLLVHPVQEVMRFLPAILAVFVFGRTARENEPPWWVELAFVVVPIVIGLWRWYTTSYRIGESALQVRTGLLNRATLTAKLDRVRTVDVTAPPLHRILGLSRVKIGTGADKPVELNGLGSVHAARLRAELLHRGVSGAPNRAAATTEASRAAAPATDAGAPDTGAAASAPYPASPTDTPPAGPLPASSPARPDAWAPPAPGTAPTKPARSLPLPGVYPSGPASGPLAPGHLADEEIIASFDPRWVLLAPFTFSGLLAALAVWAFIGQYANRIVERVAGSAFGDTVQRHIESSTWWFVVLEAVVILVVVGIVLSTTSYVLAYWGYRLTRHREGTLHVVRGLLTSRATSLEEARIRGTILAEPFVLRLVRGAKARALTTGFNRAEQSVQTANDLLTPPAPSPVVGGVVATVMRDEEPLRTSLLAHGPAARRRRLTRTLIVAVVAAVPSLVGMRTLGWPTWTLIPAAILLALAWPMGEGRYRALGHRVLPGHVVARSGLFPRERTMLMRSGVIGWNAASSFFQRRAGLVTLVATNAAGSGSVVVLDVPQEEAVRVMLEVSPETVTPFLAGPLRPRGEVAQRTDHVATSPAD